MEQRDYILREIDKIGVVVRAILGKIRGKEIQFGEQNESVLHHSSFLSEELKMDIESVVKAPIEQVKELLSLEKGFDSENIELLADMLSELSVVSPPEDEIILQKRALDLYAYSIEIDKTFSVERSQKVDDLSSKLPL